MNYFFVFQNTNYEKEKKGSYLWAPKDSNGKTVSHWEMMKNVKKDDLIIHSYKMNIVAYSFAKEDAYSLDKPNELEGFDYYYAGWRIDLDYYNITNPIVTSKYRKLIRKLKWYKYAPFNKNGIGNSGYLFKASKELITLLLKASEENQTDPKERERIRKARMSYGLLNDEEVLKDDNELLDDLCEMDLDDGAPVIYEEKPREKLKTVKDKKGRVSYPRSSIVAANALKLAGHKCEIEASHNTFLRKKDGLPYTEPHHLIPLSKHGKFKKSLDVEGNVVSLCSHCHNHLHYGKGINDTLKMLYEKRKEKLEIFNINLTFDELSNFYS